MDVLCGPYLNSARLATRFGTNLCAKKSKLAMSVHLFFSSPPRLWALSAGGVLTDPFSCPLDGQVDPLGVHGQFMVGFNRIERQAGFFLGVPFFVQKSCITLPSWLVG